jgi:hypothetical protein
MNGFHGVLTLLLMVFGTRLRIEKSMLIGLVIYWDSSLLKIGIKSSSITFFNMMDALYLAFTMAHPAQQ